MLGATLMFLAVGGLLGTDDPANDAGKKELAKLKGTWSIVFSEIRGRKLVVYEGDRSVIDGDKLTATRDGKASHTSTIRLDPSKSPKQIDITFEHQDGTKTVSPGIYKLEGDTLTVCVGFPDGERPDQFESNEKNMLTVIKRSD